MVRVSTGTSKGQNVTCGPADKNNSLSTIGISLLPCGSAAKFRRRRRANVGDCVARDEYVFATLNESVRLTGNCLTESQESDRLLSRGVNKCALGGVS